MEQLSKLFQEQPFIFIPLLAVTLSANEGISFGNETRSFYTNNFNSAIANPLTSDSSFKTKDGTKDFKASLTCSDKNNPYLRISYSGSSDINVNVSIDSNLDSNFDKSYSFAGVSAVGTNGVMKCNPNSWSNCKSYGWKIYNNSLILEQIHRKDLSGAYCINSTCGSLSVHNKKDILNTLGGAISSLYQTYSSKYLISQTINNGSFIEFYGQNFEDCKNLKGKDKAPKFNGSADDSNLDYSTEQLKQSQDSSSAYFTLNKNIANQNQNKSLSDDFKSDLTYVNSNVDSELTDSSNYTFSYTSKRKNKAGEWEDVGGNGKVNINFLSPDIKYCEVSYLVVNSQVLTDNSTKQTSRGETDTYKVEMRECTGTDYSICPIDTSKGETISQECGVNNSFSKVTSMMYSLQEMSNDVTCHKGE